MTAHPAVDRLTAAPAQITSATLQSVSRERLWEIHGELQADRTVRRVTTVVLYVMIKSSDAWGMSFRNVFTLGQQAGCCEASVRNAIKELEGRRIAFRRPMASLSERGRWQQRCNSFFLFPEANAPAPVGPVHDGTKGSTFHWDRMADWAMLLAHRQSRMVVLDFTGWKRDIMHVSAATADQVRAAAARFRDLGISDDEANRVMASMLLSWDNARVGSDPTQALQEIILYRRDTAQSKRTRGRPRKDARTFLGSLYEPDPLPRVQQSSTFSMDDLIADGELRDLWTSTIVPALDVPPATQVIAFDRAQLFRRRSDPASIVIAAQSDANLERIQAHAPEIQSQIQSLFPDVSVSYTTIPPS